MGYEKLKRIHFRSLFLAIVPGEKKTLIKHFRVYLQKNTFREISRKFRVLSQKFRVLHIFAESLFILQNLESVLDSYTYIHK